MYLLEDKKAKPLIYINEVDPSRPTAGSS